MLGRAFLRGFSSVVSKNSTLTKLAPNVNFINIHSQRSTFFNFARNVRLRTNIPVQQHILLFFSRKTAYAPLTITYYLSVISYVHKLNGLQDSWLSFVVQNVLYVTEPRKLKPTTDVSRTITKAILQKVLDFLQH